MSKNPIIPVLTSLVVISVAANSAWAAYTKTIRVKILFETGQGNNRDQGGDGVAFAVFEVPNPSFFIVHSALNIDTSKNYHGVKISNGGGSSCTRWTYSSSFGTTHYSYCVNMRKSGSGNYHVHTDDKSEYPGTFPVRNIVDFNLSFDGSTCSVAPISASRSFNNTSGQYAGSIVSSECNVN